jgi:hypothetical protein
MGVFPMRARGTVFDVPHSRIRLHRAVEYADMDVFVRICGGGGRRRWFNTAAASPGKARCLIGVWPVFGCAPPLPPAAAWVQSR